MQPKQIRAHLRAVPFQPIRIFLTDGSFYDVPRPDWAFVCADRLEIAKDVTSEGVPWHTVTCHPADVTRIEPQPQSIY